MLQVVYLIYQNYIYYLVKWVVHILTGKCGIERVLESKTVQGERLLALERQILFSKTSIKNIVDDFTRKTSKSVQTLTGLGGTRELFSVQDSVKRIRAVKVFAFAANKTKLDKSMTYICGYRNLIRTAEDLRVTKFDENNGSHVLMLEQLWSCLKLDDADFKRKGEHWKTLGFQGDDPVTDLRGMGMLGLSNLVYFATNHPESAKQLLIRSHNPTIGCSVAITGIDLTNLCYQFLLFGTLKYVFYYQEGDITCDLATYQETFAKVFQCFDSFWIESKPESIMDYGNIRRAFEERLRECILTQHKLAY
ncbi:ELMO domain-containing protein 2-like [Convolutriloba macropyga]|uniref:ELMO domain-containing protein 2-like n=1 Tax=Convolutriloba macropyga TaxID=536237 RepID=UPI003F520E10